MSYFRPGLGATMPVQRVGKRTSTSMWSRLPSKLPALAAGASQRVAPRYPRPPTRIGVAPRYPRPPTRIGVTPPSRDKRSSSTPAKPMTAPVSTHPTTSSGAGAGGGGGGGVMTAPAPAPETSWTDEPLDELDPAVAPEPGAELEAAPKKSLSTAAKVGIGVAAALLLVPAIFNK